MICRDEKVQYISSQESHAPKAAGPHALLGGAETYSSGSARLRPHAPAGRYRRLGIQGCRRASERLAHGVPAAVRAGIIARSRNPV